MVSRMSAFALVLAMIFQIPPAYAGVYADEMTKCLVGHMSSSDKAASIRWMFAVISLNPAVQPLSSVTAKQREAATKSAVDLLQRLVFQDCHKETVKALKYEGRGASSAAFSVVRQVAIRGMMSSPAVAAGMKTFGTYVDKQKWMAMGKEANVSAPARPAAATPK